jgi:hypothetical protein
MKACNWIQDSIFIIEYQTSKNFMNFFEIMVNLYTYAIQLQPQKVFMTNSLILVINSKGKIPNLYTISNYFHDRNKYI